MRFKKLQKAGEHEQRALVVALRAGLDMDPLLQTHSLHQHPPHDTQGGAFILPHSGFLLEKIAVPHGKLLLLTSAGEPRDGFC